MIWDKDGGLSGYLNIRGPKEGQPVWTYQGKKSTSQGIYVGSQWLRLADFTGEGKADLARIHEKRVLWTFISIMAVRLLLLLVTEFDLLTSMATGWMISFSLTSTENKLPISMSDRNPALRTAGSGWLRTTHSISLLALTQRDTRYI